MRTTVKTLMLVAIWITVAGVVLQGLGYLSFVLQPPNTGANIGGGGALLFGMAAIAGGLLVGAAAGVAWLRVPKTERRSAVPLLPWQKRLRRLTAAAMALIGVGAAVQFAGAVSLMHETAFSDWSDTYAIAVTGLGISALGLLAAVPYVVYWVSWRRTAARLSRRTWLSGGPHGALDLPEGAHRDDLP
ncbi:hypothetical protein [Amycolatopsis orientalis]|uniref:hypothetical protein n=1 Tax=Amycolatopsis orientalis TaxID=31958 RepID=UPI001319F446|nr:hypothetical protein [Amycolatopsis orientalis]